MNPVSAISLSGMNAAQTALDVAGHNIANLNTAGFRRQESVQAAAPQGGVSTTLRQAAEPGASLESDVVGELSAKNAFLANLAVFKTGNRMLGALLDERS